MAITRTAWTDDDGTGTTGTIINNAEKTTLYNQIDSLVGEWTDVTFAAGNFSANGSMTWTVTAGEVALNRWMKINKLLIWSVQLALSTVGGTPNTQLLIAAPGGFSFATTANFMRCAYAADNGSLVEAYVSPADATHLAIARTTGANWSASTLLSSAYFTWMGQTT